MTALMVILGGAIGAPLRYLADRAVQSRQFLRSLSGLGAMIGGGPAATGVVCGAPCGPAPVSVA